MWPQSTRKGRRNRHRIASAGAHPRTGRAEIFAKPPRRDVPRGTSRRHRAPDRCRIPASRCWLLSPTIRWLPWQPTPTPPPMVKPCIEAHDGFRIFSRVRAFRRYSSRQNWRPKAKSPRFPRLVEIGDVAARTKRLVTFGVYYNQLDRVVVTPFVHRGFDGAHHVICQERSGLAGGAA